MFNTMVDIDLLGIFNVLRASFGYPRKPGASLIAITAPQAWRLADCDHGAASLAPR